MESSITLCTTPNYADPLFRAVGYIIQFFLRFLLRSTLIRESRQNSHCSNLHAACCTPLSEAWCYPTEHTNQGPRVPSRSEARQATPTQPPVLPYRDSLRAATDGIRLDTVASVRWSDPRSYAARGYWVLSSTQYIARMLYSLQFAVRPSGSSRAARAVSL